MARYNEILVGRFNRWLQKMLSMKGPASLISLSDELFTVLPILAASDTFFHQGWDLFALQTQVAAAASNQSGMRIRNPTGSNVAAILTGFTLSNLNAAAISYQIDHGAQTADLATITSLANVRLDNRGRNLPTCILSTQNTTPSITALNIITLIALVANTSFDLLRFDVMEIPLLPGDATTIFTSQLNTQLNASFYWRERFLEESERT